MRGYVKKRRKVFRGGVGASKESNLKWEIHRNLKNLIKKKKKKKVVKFLLKSPKHINV